MNHRGAPPDAATAAPEESGAVSVDALREDPSNSPAAADHRGRIGILLGLVGVLGFSLTLPATRVADPRFGAYTVGLGRAVIAGVLALLVLRLKRRKILPRDLLGSLTIVAMGVVVGFPLLTSLAMRDLPSSHGAVISGLVPAATAGAAVLRAGERPKKTYWMALSLGLAAVLLYALKESRGILGSADLLLLLAVALVGFGYAEGAVLARQHGGWQVICWALVLSLPVVTVGTVMAVLSAPPRTPTAGSLLGFAYLSGVSMFLAFFAWYQGLAIGGIARVGRLQLLQPPLTVVWGALLLNEHISAALVLTVVVVLISIFFGRRTTTVPAPASVPTARQPSLQ